MSMFCYQCQETAHNEGCFIRGVCGKPEDIAQLQDCLVYVLKGLSVYAVKARALGLVDDETDLFVAQALFTTLTNVNFDADRLVALSQKGLVLRERLRDQFLAAYQQRYGVPFSAPLPEAATWSPDGKVAACTRKGAEVGMLADAHLDEDRRSLRQVLIYGLKGLAAYCDHAAILNHFNADLPAFCKKGWPPQPMTISPSRIWSRSR